MAEQFIQVSQWEAGSFLIDPFLDVEKIGEEFHPHLGGTGNLYFTQISNGTDERTSKIQQ